MPGYAQVNPSTASITDILFSELARELSNYKGETFPFYVGETWLKPAPGLTVDTLTLDQHPELYHYPPSYGRSDLLALLASRLARRAGIAISTDNLVVSAGGIGALASIAGTILEPGDEVIILGPYWPLIPGIVKLYGGLPVILPFWGAVDSAQAVADSLERAATGRTTCVYINSPNNPTGRLLPEAWQRVIIEFARRRGLWIISDEAYDEFAYEGPHVYTYSLAPERVFASYSFSKAFGVPGHRCGYAVGPKSQIAIARKVTTHLSYGSPMVSQIAACRLLSGGGEDWACRARQEYQAIGKFAADRLQVSRPEGGHYLWVEIADVIDSMGFEPFMKGCIARGVLVAPGTLFGSYPTFVRICFTCLAPDAVMRGIEILADIMGR
jgi:N-succinyldiaminopimelate aminotransferase